MVPGFVPQPPVVNGLEGLRVPDIAVRQVRCRGHHQGDVVKLGCIGHKGADLRDHAILCVPGRTPQVGVNNLPQPIFVEEASGVFCASVMPSVYSSSTSPGLREQPSFHRRAFQSRRIWRVRHGGTRALNRGLHLGNRPVRLQDPSTPLPPEISSIISPNIVNSLLTSKVFSGSPLLKYLLSRSLMPQTRLGHSIWIGILGRGEGRSVAARGGGRQTSG